MTVSCWLPCDDLARSKSGLWAAPLVRRRGPKLPRPEAGRIDAHYGVTMLNQNG